MAKKRSLDKLEREVQKLSKERRQIVQLISEIKGVQQKLSPSLKEYQKLENQLQKLSKEYRRIVDLQQELKKLLSRMKNGV